MIKSIIVEDDPKHYKTLQEKIHKSPSDIEVLAVVTNIADACDAIEKHKPQLVFLDIDLENGDNGFDLLKQYEKPNFSVIFTTSHNTSAYIKAAFRASALDYLSKPIDDDEFNIAVSKIDRSENMQQVQTLVDNITSDDGKIHVIWIMGYEGHLKIEINNILYCESENDLTIFHLLEPVEKRKRHICSPGIGAWEKTLSNSTIFRIHNEYLVNETHVIRYNSRINGGAELKLSDKTIIPVSKARKQDTRLRLGL